jgi:hypothetical protein
MRLVDWHAFMRHPGASSGDSDAASTQRYRREGNEANNTGRKEHNEINNREAGERDEAGRN